MLEQWTAFQHMEPTMQQPTTHYWRQFIRLRAAFSGATKDFILPIFHICSSTLSMIPCSGTNTSNFYSALWKKLEENKRQRELPRKKVVQKVVQVWWRREEGADCQLQHGQEVSFNKQLFKYLCWILLVKKIWFFFLGDSINTYI